MNKMKTEIIPVIHKIDDSQVKSNVETCLSCDIKKVFIIDHNISKPKVYEDLIKTAQTVKWDYKMWVGVNLLGVSTVKALSHDILVDALWCDESISPTMAKRYREFKGQFFGGLAFKYQPQPTDLEKACMDAVFATDVATTSGPATGKAATVPKIKLLRSYLGTHPMAIASGVNADNVASYNGLADYLMVASSITDHNELIDADKLKELISKLNQ